MKISNKKLFIDFKYFSWENHCLEVNYEEIIDEFWNDSILEDHGFPFSALTPVFPNCQKIYNYKLLNLFSYHMNKEIRCFCRG
jgi:hypothetical protein